MHRKRLLSLCLLCLCLCLTACQRTALPPASSTADTSSSVSSVDAVPAFDGETAYVVINGNRPTFSPEELVTASYERYAPLDSLGRCGVAMACIGRDLMPTEERGSIGSVKPSGWQTVKYDIVDGKYLYNRCHLIGYQLSGENANRSNLITGTRYLNIEGMLPFENMVADYVKETGNHVLYRVTPVFEEDNLLASGVQMEGYSVEDGGEGICFHIYAYNAQPGIAIDYATGASNLGDTLLTETSGQVATYILNINTKKFHLPTCGGAVDMKAENKQEVLQSRESLLAEGYAPCGICHP